jgi:hypothetical protein
MPEYEASQDGSLDRAGKEYYTYRSVILVTDKIGLTDLYNRFHDPEEKSPDILRLRELHTAMDRAVLDAYGWHEIPTACEFLLDYEEDDESPEPGKKARKKKKPWRYRWPDDIRDEVLAKLLALNAERHAEEVAQGIAPGMKPAKKPAKKTPKKVIPFTKPSDDGQIELFPQPAKVVAVKKAVRGSRPYKAGFARQLIAAEILSECYEESTMGRVKLQKLLHLCEYQGQVGEIEGDYARKAAGPFDNKMMFGIAGGLERQKWFESVKADKGTSYKKLEKAGGHSQYLSRLNGNMEKVRETIRTFKTANTRQCEIVSTLYAAWNDFLIEGHQPDDGEIIEQASSGVYWHENKESIPKEKWPAALTWMREKGIIPTGWGAHTRRD